MVELSKQIKETLNRYGMSIDESEIEYFTRRGKGGYCAEVVFYSPTGKEEYLGLDFDGTNEGFVIGFTKAAKEFDIDSFCEEDIMNRGNDGIPDSVRLILDNAEAIKDTLLKVAEALAGDDDKDEDGDEEDPCNMSAESYYAHRLEVSRRTLMELIAKVEAPFGDELSSILVDAVNRIEALEDDLSQNSGDDM